MNGRGLQVAVCAAVCALVLTGCRHKAAGVAAIPPPPVPSISVPPPTHHFEALPAMETEDAPSLALLLQRQPLPRFRPLPTTARQLALLLPAAPTPALQLGELTTGGEAANQSLRGETEALLQGQRQRLRNLPPAVSTAHGREVEQARLFTRQALEAWQKRDVEGARVLATKAKVLLDEMQD